MIIGYVYQLVQNFPDGDRLIYQFDNEKDAEDLKEFLLQRDFNFPSLEVKKAEVTDDWKDQVLRVL